MIICPSVDNLAYLLQSHKTNKQTIVVASGLFETITIDNLHYLQHSKFLSNKGILAVIITSPEKDRLEIVASIRGVDYVVYWGDESNTIDEAIKRLKPDIYASPNNIAPPICKEICNVSYNVGAPKI